MLKVIKKLNNNVVLALNESKEEIIIVGIGLGFEKIPYMIPEHHARIEKYMLLLKTQKHSNLWNELVKQI